MSMDRNADFEATRDAILLATLGHVAFDGWTRRALAAGVADAGLKPDMAGRAFGGGGLDLIAHFSDWADRAMLARLGDLDLASMRVRHRLGAGVRARIEPLAPHREAVRRALAVLAMPHNAWLAARLTWCTVDAIWYAAGDTATDFNFYTKRALLAPVYATSLLYWLGDASPAGADTWAYLERRIGDALGIGRLGSRFRRAASRPA
jgi:ubiquinone biosynthesis protein COQ9